MKSLSLRTGITTGSCAAGAAAAAVRLLLTGNAAEKIAVGTPAGITVYPEILAIGKIPGGAFCEVRKDAGDDPDVTNGTRIRAEVWPGTGPIPGGIEMRKFYEDPAFPGLSLTGGTGVGTVTLPGLPDPVGFPAINPVPRQMIFRAVSEEIRKNGGSCGQNQRYRIVISVPEGEKLAAKTFNPKLGVTGGISILGTSGIVRPMSEDALIESIRLDIRTKTARGMKTLAAAPGHYGAGFLGEHFGIPERMIVTISNYVGDSFRMMAEENARAVLFAGHPGKLIKVSGGVMNTHSKYGDRRMEMMAEAAREAGAGEELVREVLGRNTTDEACGVLRRYGILLPAMTIAAEKIRSVLEDRFTLRVGVVLFSEAADFTAMSENAPAILSKVREEAEKYA